MVHRTWPGPGMGVGLESGRQLGGCTIPGSVPKRGAATPSCIRRRNASALRTRPRTTQVYSRLTWLGSVVLLRVRGRVRVRVSASYRVLAGHRVLRIEERACELAVSRPTAQFKGMLELGASREASLTLASRGAAWVRPGCGMGAAWVRHGPSSAALVTASTYSDSFSYHLLALPTCGATASARTSGSRGGPRGAGRADGGHRP